MNSPAPVYLIAFLGAFAAAYLSLPLWRRWSLRAGLVDEPGPRKIQTAPVSLAGGLAVMTGLAIPAALALVALWIQPAGLHGWLDASVAGRLREQVTGRGIELAALAAGAVGMLLVGLWDDRHELRPAVKFGAQLVVAFLVAATGARVTLFVPSALFSYAVTILWILTVINAFNFIDNMNGLCAGLGAIGAFYFAVLSAAAGQSLVAGVAFSVCGALLGFLPHNFPVARAFLGDAGSHLAGYLLAVLAILPHFHSQQHPRPLAVLSPLLILAVPLGDLLRVVLVRLRAGRPFYVGDACHLSHRLVERGMTRTRAVLLLWLAAAVLGALVLL